MWQSCAVATCKYSRLLLPENYVYIVVLAPDSQRASFYSVILSHLYSSTVNLLSLYNDHEQSYMRPEDLLRCQEVIISLLCDMVHQFM